MESAISAATTLNKNGATTTWQVQNPAKLSIFHSKTLFFPSPLRKPFINLFLYLHRSKSLKKAINKRLAATQYSNFSQL